MKEVIESKNVILGRNYVVASRQNILRADGIQCFEKDETNERRLIVVESKSTEDEVSQLIPGIFLDFILIFNFFTR